MSNFNNDHTRYTGNSARKFEKQIDQYPTKEQKETYDRLYKQCDKYIQVKRRKKPTTRAEYSDEITYLIAFLKERNKKNSSAPVKLYSKDKVLSLFDKMNAAQQARFIAYGEGILNEVTASEKKA